MATSNIVGAGLGLFASERVDEGQFICEYVGETIDDTESERRGRINSSKHVSYLFDRDVDTVDAGRIGNKARVSVGHREAASRALASNKDFTPSRVRLSSSRSSRTTRCGRRTARRRWCTWAERRACCSRRSAACSPTKR